MILRACSRDDFELGVIMGSRGSIGETGKTLSPARLIEHLHGVLVTLVLGLVESDTEKKFGVLGMTEVELGHSALDLVGSQLELLNGLFPFGSDLRVGGGTGNWIRLRRKSGSRHSCYNDFA
jgi:hypothetical protein